MFVRKPVQCRRHFNAWKTYVEILYKQQKLIKEFFQSIREHDITADTLWNLIRYPTHCMLKLEISSKIVMLRISELRTVLPPALYGGEVQLNRQQHRFLGTFHLSGILEYMYECPSSSVTLRRVKAEKSRNQKNPYLAWNHRYPTADGK